MEKQIQLINNAIDQLEAHLPSAPIKAPKVSARAIDWHIEHSLKAAILIIDALEESDPAQFKPKFSPTKTLILQMGRIPRGRAVSPDILNNKGEISLGKVPEMIGKLRNLLLSTQKKAEKSYFDHPIFGHMKRNEALRFVAIHSHHHLKIIQDILAAQTN
ncbi:Protein of unknown function (DUF1569) [Saprospira grandis DSM 2844]|uniref:DinB-like domain-containing protein n=1 Tax=Saprospira grandis DSM 2844 TaxID=694433 RepID=J0XWE3_9BACT|nr:hypothetical protein [Saprospira grandis]EJF53351.1 Protein of unknown function (DUF1569) [Saprospira grandis DSM 2844]